MWYSSEEEYERPFPFIQGGLVFLVLELSSFWVSDDFSEFF